MTAIPSEQALSPLKFRATGLQTQSSPSVKTYTKNKLNRSAAAGSTRQAAKPRRRLDISLHHIKGLCQNYLFGPARNEMLLSEYWSRGELLETCLKC